MNFMVAKIFVELSKNFRNKYIEHPDPTVVCIGSPNLVHERLGIIIC